jgi:hypothetical protein
MPYKKISSASRLAAVFWLVGAVAGGGELCIASPGEDSKATDAVRTISAESQIFVDDVLVAHKSGVVRKVHRLRDGAR